MTPAARIAAAIAVLDEIRAGDAAERALTNWARRSRYAGSGDRAAVRDYVFDALRCRRSFGWLGGGEDGRALMLGALRAGEFDPSTVFTGEGHAPAPVTADDEGQPLDIAPEAVRLDTPDWLVPDLKASLGDDFAPVMATLRHRAPVFLRANLARTTRDEAARTLAEEGIETRPSPLAATALEVTARARAVSGSAAYRDGLVELQDAASQAVVEALPQGGRVLDYCAGGGGKSLALAARGAEVFAHDANPGRMRDLPARAERAGVRIAQLQAVERAAPFDLVLTDVPCSGSGSWRRAPEGKWRLTADMLERLEQTQAAILRRAAPLVAPGGALAYATCSLLGQENAGQIRRFMAENSGWHLAEEHRFTPLDGGDGFYLAVLRHKL
ncbi:SAM-dependent methyltransferase [Haematobacter massiliensis]|uniref:RsmB/NOP family class I SAM-dependent RNA methyltransferase n=2 Tax=Haematobacter massiliensis TaxID=195105 RepID=UPI000B49872C|nr:RsmB/NOP family class I SAM-dependent RNA methyltransferase [Haematobacter massiliensis]OWJ71856.1 SAM-dependent methyltransferase [Haematobacter massiliensis]QBJ23924.1 RsmB/NOP family class I SAM-dependent RNA methyltransferase [Haematobacter massiliensis]